MSRLDRRALFTSGAAAALLAATGVSLSAAPRPGGRLRLAVPRADSRFEIAVRGAVFETLTEIGADGLLRPELAISWNSDAEGRVWDLTVRAGVLFHNGRPFTADFAARSVLAHGLEVNDLDVSDDTLHIVLDAPNPQLPYLLADPKMVMRLDGEDGNMPIGTGLYRTERYEPGRHFFGRRVQPHYKDGQAGWFDSVEIAVIPDPSVRAEAVRDGFVDVADLPQADALGDTATKVLGSESGKQLLAAREGMGVPAKIGNLAPLDDGRITQRWWMM